MWLNINTDWIRLVLFFCIANITFGKVATAQKHENWSEVGRIPVRYFDTTIFDATPSNWAITQDEKGTIYAGNNAGLLIHNGDTWEVLPVPGNIIRSLTLGADKKVYIGSFGELGYLGADSLGGPMYVSLKDHIPSPHHEFADVWHTYPFNDGVFFQTSGYLFRWQNNSMHVWEPESRFTNIIPLQELFLITEPERVFYISEEDSLQEIEIQGASLSKHMKIIHDGPESILAITEQGFVHCDINVESVSVCTLQESDIDTLLQNDRPFTMVRLPDGNLAVGFDGKGIALLDPSYRLLRLIDDRDGLVNLEVMDLFRDREDALWVALYDGLARVEPTDSWSTFSRTEGLPSQVNSIYRWQGKVFATTMLGIFELNSAANYSPANFSPVKGGDNFLACDGMAVIDSTLIAACVAGLAKIHVNSEQSGVITSLHESFEDYRNILPDAYNPSIFYVTGDNGISKVQLRDGKTEFLHTEPFSPVVYELLIDPVQQDPSSTRIWATAHPGLLYRIDIPQNESQWRILQIGESHELEGKLTDIFFWSDTLRAATEEGLYDLHTSISDIPVFKKNEFIGEREINQVGIDSKGNGWVILDDTMRVAIPSADGVYATSAPMISSRIDVSDIATLFEDSDGILWFGHSRGIERAVPQPGKISTSKPTVYLEKIAATSNDSLLLRGEALFQNSLVLPHKEASLRFTYAAQVFDLPDNVQYRVRLEGLNPGWTKWTRETMKEYTNLPEGSYTFMVQAKNLAGITSETQQFHLRVLPPWHRTGWAYTLWGLLGCLLFLGAVKIVNRYQTRRLQARNEKLNKLVEEQTEEIKAKNISLSVAYEEAQVINDNLVESNRILENSMDQLRDALEANKEILGITAHDLKNPLGGIIGLAEMVIQDFENGTQSTYESAVDNLPMLKDEAERMLQIIKDLLDRHREGAHTTINKERVLLGDIVSAVIRWNKKQAKNKGIHLEYFAEENTIVDVDIMSMQRVLDNYVSNSIKYSPPHSRVWIDVKREDAVVRVSVRDEGPGLTDQDMQKVFGKLQRLSATPTAGEHSTGLGLYIVKKLVSAHGGEVGVDSVYGEGASFWFTLPLVDHEKEPLNEDIHALAD